MSWQNLLPGWVDTGYRAMAPIANEIHCKTANKRITYLNIIPLIILNETNFNLESSLVIIPIQCCAGFRTKLVVVFWYDNKSKAKLNLKYIFTRTSCSTPLP